MPTAIIDGKKIDVHPGITIFDTAASRTECSRPACQAQVMGNVTITSPPNRTFESAE